MFHILLLQAAVDNPVEVLGAYPDLVSPPLVDLVCGNRAEVFLLGDDDLSHSTARNKPSGQHKKAKYLRRVRGSSRGGQRIESSRRVRAKTYPSMH